MATRFGVPLPELNPPATPERIAAAGEQLGITIPDDLAALLQAADGRSLFGHGITFNSLHRYSPKPSSQADDIPLVSVTLVTTTLMTAPEPCR